MIETQSKMVPFIELDVNYSLGYHPDKDLHQVEDLLCDVKPYQFVGRETIYSLTEEKFLLHLIMHQYKEATLYWMVHRNRIRSCINTWIYIGCSPVRELTEKDCFSCKGTRSV